MIIVHLSRTQYELLLALQDNERVSTDRLTRRTIDALVHSDLAYETDSGWLCISSQGRKATRLVGYAVQVPS